MPIILLILLLMFGTQSQAAISSATIWEVRTAGSDTNGGGYVATGTDMSQFNNKNAAGCSSCQSATVNISTSDGVTAGTTTVTSATGNYSSALIGNLAYIAGGTGSVTGVWKQVMTVPGATSFTVDSSTGLTAGTGVTINIGGALLSPGTAAAQAASNNTVYFKSGTYPITSASSNVAGGVASFNTAQLEGYNATRGDLGTAPIFQASAISTATILTTGATGVAKNITVDGATLTAIKCISLADGVYYKLKAMNCTNGGIANSGGIANCFRCEASGNTTAGFGIAVTNCIGCESHGNTVSGFAPTTSSFHMFCLSYGNTGATSDGFAGATSAEFLNSVAYANGRDGFRLSAVSESCTNCIAESNVGTGINSTGANGLILNGAVFGNGTNVVSSGARAFNIGQVTGTASFFTNAASSDFSLNAIASAGAAARAAGIPAIFPSGTTTAYQDIGAAQHANPAIVTGSPIIQ